MSSQTLRDCVIVSDDGQEFAVHSSRMKKVWPLGAKLINLTREYPMLRIELDIETEIVDLIVKYVNNGDYESILAKWNLRDKLLRACADMQLKELQYKILHTLSQRMNSSCSLYVWGALRTANHPSQENALDSVLFQLRTMKKSRDFLELSLDEIRTLLGHKRLHVHSEDEVWGMAKTWIEAKPIERKEHLATLFSLIRFQTRQEVSALIDKEQLLSSNGIRVQDADMHWTRREPRSFLLALNGWSAAALQDIDIFSNYTNRFVRFHMIEDHANPVAYAIAEVLDGKIYVVGGGAADKFFNSVRIFDPAAMQWRSSAPSMKIPRCYPSSAVLNGKLFVIGGFDGSQRTNSVEFYNPKTNAWKAAARMLERRSDSAAAVMNGFLYVFGGVSITNVLDTVERYDPATNRWTFIGTMPHKASGVTAIAWEGEILLIGGSDDGVRLKNVLRFTKHHTFRAAGQLNVARSNAGVACYNGKVYVAGGYSHEVGGVIDSVEVYEDGAWKTCCRLPRVKSGLKMVTIDNWPKAPRSFYHVPNSS